MLYSKLVDNPMDFWNCSVFTALQCGEGSKKAQRGGRCGEERKERRICDGKDGKTHRCMVYHLCTISFTWGKFISEHLLFCWNLN